MIKRAINAVLWDIRHRKFMLQKRKQLQHSDFTFFSCNCVGGVLYHDLGLPFLSPFVNLYLSCEDFIRFCEAPREYLSLPLTPAEQFANYPMANLGDLTLHLVHYDSFAQAKEAWERRVQRICFDRVFLVATDRDGFNEELSRRFDLLPYPKVLFVHRPDDNPNHFYIPGFEKQGQVGDLIKKAHPRNGRRYMDHFDWIKFLNQEA